MSHKKKRWERPSIVSHIMPVNSIDGSSTAGYMNTIDQVSISELVGEFGSPLFVLSESRLRHNIKELIKAFKTRYADVVYAWSYKTNYLNAVCQILHQEGAWAEVVSGFEYEKARALGVPGQCIIFNGPHKSQSSLERAIAENAHINIDNLNEIYALEAIATRMDREVTVSIRLNFMNHYNEAWPHFGFNIDNGQALEAVKRISETHHLHLRGLHSHIGTFVLDTRAYQEQVRTMCDFIVTAEKEFDCVMESIDIGGGFASCNALQGVYLPPEQIVPSIEQYAEAICTTLLPVTKQRMAQGKKPLTLLLETGRAVVDDAEYLISSVVATKSLPNGQACAVLDAGVNVLFTGFWYNHKVHLAQPLQGIPQPTTLYGPLCMNIDVVRADIKLPPLHESDQLVISPVGAYNNTQWMQFIEYRPNVVMIHSDDGAVSVIRQAETLQTINDLERTPEHLSTHQLGN